MGKRRGKEIKSGLKDKPPDPGINELTDVVNQQINWKSDPPDRNQTTVETKATQDTCSQPAQLRE